MFKATKGNYQIEKQDNCFILDRWDKVPTTQGYLFAKDLTTQNVLQTNKENIQIKNIQEKRCLTLQRMKDLYLQKHP